MEVDRVDQSKSDAVAQRIRSMIHAGTLPAGAALPSTRSLATELGVSRGTVVAAYEQLDGEGYIRTRHGAAARVVPAVEGMPSADGAAAGLPTTSRTLAAQTFGAAARGETNSGAPDAAAPRRGTLPVVTPGAPVIDARPGIPAVTAISARDWRAAWRTAADMPLHNSASEPAGTGALRAHIAGQLGLSRSFTPDPARVIVTAGTSDVISLVTEALRVDRGRMPRIAVEDPGYPGGRHAITSAGGVIVPVAVDDDGLDVSLLDTVGPLDAVMVTPTHQYPLGSVMPVARRRALLEWAARRGALVIEDDYDSEFRHRGSPVPALAALDAEGVVVHLGGFSKILDPRLRCAYLVTPEASFASALHAAREARGPAVAEPVQAALVHLLASGALRRHLGRVRRDYAHKRSRITQRLAAASVPGLEARALGGGLHVVLTWPGRPRVEDVVSRLEKRGILVSDLAAYRVGAPTSEDLAGVVVGYGGVSPADVDRTLDALLAEITSSRPR